MFHYFRLPPRDENYSSEVDRFYREARNRDIDYVRGVAYPKMSCISRLLIRVGLKEESARVVGYSLRLEELI